MSRLLPVLLAVAAIGLLAWAAFRADEVSKGPPDLAVPAIPGDSGSVGDDRGSDQGPSPIDPPVRPSRVSVPDSAAPPPRIGDARDYLDEGRPLDAIDVLGRIIAANPGDLEALRLRGRTYLGLGGTWRRRAAHDLRAVIEKEESAPVLEDLATALAPTTPDTAIRHLARAMELAPLRARPHALLARIHLRRGREEQAREEVEKALTLDPTDPLAQTLARQLR